MKEPQCDNVPRWQSLLDDYPEARYTFAAPYFYGALRNDDDVMRAVDLGRLIGSLLARERHRNAGNGGSL